MRYKSRFQALMWRVSAVSLLCLAALQVLYGIFGLEVLSSLRTTALTVFYHFAVRLAVGEWLIP